MEKLLFLLSYVILFPLLRAVRAGFRGVPEPLAWKNQHDEERARERKVDMSAQLTGVIRGLLSHRRAEALRNGLRL